MKKLILAAFALTTAASVFAQGTVIFYNNVNGSVRTHVYAPLASNVYFSQIGNGTADQGPVGATNWSAFTLIGASTAAQYGAAPTVAQLLAAPGSGASEASLVPAAPTTSFRTGGGQGYFVQVTSTLANVLPDGAATLEMVAWDNSAAGNLYPTWAQAFPAWTKGLIAAGESGRFNLTVGGTSTPPYIIGAQSFNLYFIPVPEPSTFALAGLGLAALVAFRRRNK